MSNENLEKPHGLVFCRPFSKTPQVRLIDRNIAIHDALIEFNNNTPYVVRVEGLSNPIVAPPSHASEEMSIKAVNVALSIVNEKPLLRGVSFTIIDGTPWKDVTPTDGWGLDIVFISVFWQYAQPLIAVMLGKRKRILCGKTYHLEEPDSQFAMFFAVNPNTQSDLLNYSIRRVVRAYNEEMKFLGRLRVTPVLHPFYGDDVNRALRQLFNPDREYPVAAATYLDGNVWIVNRPNRHLHIAHSQEYHEALEKADVDKNPHIQGFLTNHGNFVTRYRALYMAAKLRIILNTDGIAVACLTSSQKQKYEIESKMGGIIQPGEWNDDFAIGSTGLFSEDLW